MLLEKQAPDFKTEAYQGGKIKEIELSDYRGKWVTMFFYPGCFTFVCPTELLALNESVEAFRKRECEVVGISTDSQFSHLAWKHTPVDKGGIGDVQYPLVADLTKQISRDFGVLLEDGGVALRGTFLIDREGIVKHAVVNDLGLGDVLAAKSRVDDALLQARRKRIPPGRDDKVIASWNGLALRAFAEAALGFKDQKPLLSGQGVYADTAPWPSRRAFRPGVLVIGKRGLRSLEPAARDRHHGRDGDASEPDLQRHCRCPGDGRIRRVSSRPGNFAA